MSVRRLLRASCSALLILATSYPVCAFAQSAGDSSWHYLVEPYVLFPNQKGPITLGDLPSADLDAGPDDIFDHLQMGLMLYAEAQNNQWMVSSDLLYMDLSANVSTDRLIQWGRADFQQVGWELAVMRRLSSAFELGVAAQYNNLQAELKLDINTLLGTNSRQLKLDQDWIDPSIVGRATLPLNDKWSLQARGNIGGFGIGSDFMWQLQADAVYRSSKFLFAFGYRVMYADYDHGSGQSRFVYEVKTFGPVLKVGFNF